MAWQIIIIIIITRRALGREHVPLTKDPDYDPDSAQNVINSSRPPWLSTH